MELASFVGDAAGASGEGGSSSSSRPAPNSKNMVTRLEKILEYIAKLAMNDDESWDLRDMGRLVYHMKSRAKQEPKSSFAGAFVGVFAKQPEADGLTKALATVKKKRKPGSSGDQNSATNAGDVIQATMQSVQYRTASQVYN